MRYLLLGSCLALSLQNAHAATTLIDDFTVFQDAYSDTKPSNGPLDISSSGLTGLSRTLKITSSDSDDSGEMFSALGTLRINSDIGTTANASLVYAFAAIDLASIADALVFDISRIDTGTQLVIIANQTSELFWQNISQAGQYVVAFASFSQPGAFAHLTSLEIKFNNLLNADFALSRIAATSTTVPEPSSLALLALGVLAMRRYQVKAIHSQS